MIYDLSPWIGEGEKATIVFSDNHEAICKEYIAETPYISKAIHVSDLIALHQEPPCHCTILILCNLQWTCDLSHLLEKLECNNKVIYLEHGASDQQAIRYETDVLRVSRASDYVISSIRGTHSFRIVNEQGLNLQIEVLEGSMKIENDQSMKDDGFIMLPYGEIYFPVVEHSANGTFILFGSHYQVVDGILHYNGLNIPVSEFGIGTNTLITNQKEESISEKTFGTCHLGFGRNCDIGGTINAPFHFDVVLSDFDCMDTQSGQILFSSLPKKKSNHCSYSIALSRNNHNWNIDIVIQYDDSFGRYAYEFEPTLDIQSCMDQNGSQLDYIRNSKTLTVTCKGYIHLQYCMGDAVFIGKPSLTIPYPENREIQYDITTTINPADSCIVNNTKDLYKLVVIDNKYLIKRVCVIHNSQIQSTTLPSNIRRELTMFMQYITLFFPCINVFVYRTQIKLSLGLSYAGIILLNDSLFANPLFMLSKYLFHEIIHQYLGHFIEMEDEVLYEGLTEFMVLLYIQERYSSNIYTSFRQYYVNNAMDGSHESKFRRATLAWDYIYETHIKNKHNFKALLVDLEMENTVRGKAQNLLQLLNMHYHIDFFTVMENTVTQLD